MRQLEVLVITVYADNRLNATHQLARSLHSDETKVIDFEFVIRRNITGE